MKCYYHHDRDAFGVCRICGKGLCLECMSDKKGHGIYCKNDKHCRLRAESVITFLLMILIVAILAKVFF